MVSAQSVYDRLGVLVSKATTLQTSFLASPTGHAGDLENISAHTWYGITESLGSDIELAIEALIVAEKKIEKQF